MVSDSMRTQQLLTGRSNSRCIATVSNISLHSIASCAQQWPVHWHLYVSLLFDRKVPMVL